MSSFAYTLLGRVDAVLIKRVKKKGDFIACTRKEASQAGANPRIRNFFLSRREGAFNCEFK